MHLKSLTNRTALAPERISTNEIISWRARANEFLGIDSIVMGIPSRLVNCCTSISCICTFKFNLFVSFDCDTGSNL